MNWQELYNSVLSGESLTTEQKADIQAEAEKRGVHINKRCSSCYRDALIQFIAQDKKTEQDAHERNTNLRHWVLRKGLDVIFRGIRVNEATLTDALALRLHRAGFPKHLLWLRKPTVEELKERDERLKQSLADLKDETPEHREERLKRQEEARKAMLERRAARLAELKAKRDAEAASEAKSVETETETETEAKTDEAQD